MFVRAINTPLGHKQFRDLGTSAVKELITNSKFLLFFLNNQKILLVKRVYKMCGRPLNIHEVNLRVSNKLVIFLKFTKFLLASHVVSDVIRNCRIWKTHICELNRIEWVPTAFQTTYTQKNVFRDHPHSF